MPGAHRDQGRSLLECQSGAALTATRRAQPHGLRGRAERGFRTDASPLHFAGAFDGSASPRRHRTRPSGTPVRSPNPPCIAAHRRSPARARPSLAAVGRRACLLAGCGDKKEKAASQTAAKVNKDEITVHQINFVLQQQRNLRPEQADAASKQILERLIDQELALQKADDLKLDRDPRVVQQLEAAEREIIARAYVEKVGEAAAKPTPEEIKKYYDDKPALFKDRRIYSIQEIAIEAKPEQVPALREKLAAAKNINEFVEFLKANDFSFAGNQAVRAAEQLPLQSLDAFAR